MQEDRQLAVVDRAAEVALGRAPLETRATVDLGGVDACVPDDDLPAPV